MIQNRESSNLFLLVILFAVQSAFATESIDSARPHLDKLRAKSNATVKENDFEFPFLISQTAVSSSLPRAELIAKLGAFLKKGALIIKGGQANTRVLAEKISLESLPLPEVVRSGDQLEGIKACNVEKCLMKLHTVREKGLVEKATDKVAAYHQLVVARLKAYLTKREISGYEDRDSNVDYVKQMLTNLPFLKARYPSVESFFREGFWQGKRAPASLRGSTLREELVVIAPDRLQPIWRIGEAFEFQEPLGHLFVELHIYSNHYFDSSMRVYEVISFDAKSALILTDIIEIDELTKSGLIRMLYRGKMEAAVSVAQAEDIDKILN